MFAYSIPAYIIAKNVVQSQQPLTIAIDGIVVLSGSGAPDAIPIFTDVHTAEQYRDEQLPGCSVFELTTVGVFLGALSAMKAKATHIVFDPFRPGMQSQAALIDDILQNPPS